MFDVLAVDRLTIDYTNTGKQNERLIEIVVYQRQYISFPIDIQIC